MLLIEQEEGIKSFVETLEFAIGNNEEPYFNYNDNDELFITSSSSYCSNIIGEVLHEDINEIEGFMSYYKDNSVNFWGICTNNNFNMLLDAIRQFSYEDEVKLISSFWKKLDRTEFEPYKYISVFIGCGSHCFEGNDEWEERERSGLTSAQIIYKRKEKEKLKNGVDYLLHSSMTLNILDKEM